MTFGKEIAGLTGAAREDAILRADAENRIPPYMFAFREVPVTTGSTTVVLAVAPDWWTIDELRVPMLPSTFDTICERRGCIPPTRKMVDAIWRQAPVKVAPQPFPPDLAMTSSARYVESNNRIDASLVARYGSLQHGTLMSGAKKDICISPRRRKGDLAIYGWHSLTGTRIQPLTVPESPHPVSYVDYSHGARLVSRICTVNGKTDDVRDILHDPARAHLLSDDIDPSGKLVLFTGPIRAGDEGAPIATGGGGGGGTVVPVSAKPPASSSTSTTRATLLKRGAVALGVLTVGALAVVLGE